jgi:predicted alpha/beta-fold hydrolase
VVFPLHKTVTPARADVVPSFVPRRGLRGGHRQTIAGAYLPRRDALPLAEERLFRVDPETQVLCLCHWQPERSRALTVLVVHGLEGSSQSGYVIGATAKAWASGMNVVRMNVRNCGGTERLGPALYHSGLSGDIGAVVQELIAADKLPRLALAGFSMGGNQVLKLAGEWGREAPPAVRAVAAVSPGIDLAASSDALHEPANRLYEWNFLLSLSRSLARKARAFPERYRRPRRWWRSLRQFDDQVTAHHCGFAGAADYYARASASNVLERIALPTLVIHAQDDPFIRLTPPTRAKLAANPHIRLVETAHGGHCAFVAAADGYDGRWAERQVIEFFQRLGD